MVTLTIQITDADFRDLIRHDARKHPGRALVAVQQIEAIEGDYEFDIDDVLEAVADQSSPYDRHDTLEEWRGER